MAVGVLELCRSLRSELMALEPDLSSGQDCRAVAEELARTEKACAAARARCAARVAECGSHRGAGFADAGEWLAQVVGSSRAEAVSSIDTAALLSQCPQTREALVSGALSLAQAAEITRAEADSPGSEAELVAVAKSSGLSVLKDRARKLRLGSVSAEELAARQHRARSFRHWSDEGGMIRFSGALEPVVGVALMNRIDAHTDRLRREARAAGRGDASREAHGADALVAMVSGHARAKAMASRAELVIVCDRRAYARGYTDGDEVCHVVGGGRVRVAEARKLAEGDAFVKAVVHDGTRIDTVVHFGRHISAQLRTALELGQPPGFDGASCVDCGRRWGLQWDHVDPLANGGPTSMANLRPRCCFCHAEKTERDRKAGLLGGRGRDAGADAGAFVSGAELAGSLLRSLDRLQQARRTMAPPRPSPTAVVPAGEVTAARSAQEPAQR